MTRRGKRVSAERKECSGSPGESIFGGVKSRRFIAGVAEMNAWRRSVRAAGYCRASRTTACNLHPAIVWEREGVTPSRGQGAEPLGHFRAFSGMYGERAPAMTRRGKRVSAERKECLGSPGENL